MSKLKIALLQILPGNTICLYDRYGKLVYKYSKVYICDFGENDDESVLCAGGR